MSDTLDISSVGETQSSGEAPPQDSLRDRIVAILEQRSEIDIPNLHFPSDHPGFEKLCERLSVGQWTLAGMVYDLENGTWVISVGVSGRDDTKILELTVDTAGNLSEKFLPIEFVPQGISRRYGEPAGKYGKL